MNLDHALVGIAISMLGELGSMSKNPPSNIIDEKSTSCSTSTSAYAILFSTCPSSSKSLIIMNASAGGENCF
jgi:hypothetical protein